MNVEGTPPTAFLDRHSGSKPRISACENARAGTEAVLEIRGLHKHFGGLTAIQGLDMSISRKAIHSVIGPNGAGKTCLFNCIMGFYRPDAGEILFQGERIDGLGPDDVARKGIGRTYQNIRLFKSMTTVENVLVGRHQKLRSTVIDIILNTKRTQREESEALEQAHELLEFVGLTARGDVLARNLSYGEQRRLEIARALASEPSLILLDEPAAGMNPAETRNLMRLIQRLRAERGVTVVLIEHEMRVVMGISDVITVLDQGSRLSEGPPQTIRADHRVIEAYLGQGPTAQAMVAEERRRQERDAAANPGEPG